MKRPWFRYRLIHLLMFTLTCGAVFTVWHNREPWVLERLLDRRALGICPEGVPTDEVCDGVYPQKALNGAVYSPDGKRIVTYGFDGLSCLWDAKTGDFITILEKRPCVIDHAEFSRDGNYLLFLIRPYPELGAGQKKQGSRRGPVSVWKRDAGCQWAHAYDLCDGKRTFARAFLGGNGNAIYTLKSHVEPDPSIETWNLVNGLPLPPPCWAGLKDWPWATSCDGRLIAFDDHVLDAVTGKQVLALGLEDRWPRHFAFSPAGDRLVVCGILFDLVAGPVAETPLVLDAEDAGLKTLDEGVWCPDGRTILMNIEGELLPKNNDYGDYGRYGMKLTIRDATDLTEICSFGPIPVSRRLEYSPDGTRILLGCWDGVARIYVRRFPEWWWGHLLRPEVLILMALFAVWILVLVRVFWRRADR